MPSLMKFIILHKNNGLIRLLMNINDKISLKPYWTCLIFFKRSLNDEIPYCESKIKDIKIIKIDKNNSDLLLSRKVFEQMEWENDSNFTIEKILNKLNNGGLLFVGLNREDNVLHHTWVENGKITMQAIYLKCSINQGLAYFASTYTPIKYRKFGIGKYIRAYVLNYCRKNNFRQAVLNIASDNFASIGLAEAMGFREYQRVFFYRFLGLEVYKIKDSKSGKLVYKFSRDNGIWNYFYNNDEIKAT